MATDGHTTAGSVVQISSIRPVRGLDCINERVEIRSSTDMRGTPITMTYLLVEVHEAVGTVDVMELRHTHDAAVDSHGVTAQDSLIGQYEPMGIKPSNKHLPKKIWVTADADQQMKYKVEAQRTPL